MEALGLNPVLLIAQIISFTILFLVLKKFLYGNIQKALEERRNAVDKTFKGQAEIEKRLADFEKEQDEKQKETQKEMRKILSEARADAEKARKEIMAQAEMEKESEVERMQMRIAQDKARAQKELVDYVKSLSREIVEKTIGEKMNDKKWQKEQLNNSLEELEHASK